VESATDSFNGPRLFSPGNTLPFILVTALFFLRGIPHNLNDVLIKQFMESFEMSGFQAGLIQSAFYMGYFLLSVPAALTADGGVAGGYGFVWMRYKWLVWFGLGVENRFVR
jgi:fucose permease